MTFGKPSVVELSIGPLESELDPEHGLVFGRDNVKRIEGTRWAPKMRAVLTGAPDFEIMPHGEALVSVVPNDTTTRP